MSKNEIPLEQKQNHTSVPDNLKAGIEDLSDFLLDDIRAHYGLRNPADVQTHAYTDGINDCHIAPGQEKYLPHEAWHVAQQKAGRTKPTTEIGGMPINDNDSIENEDDLW